MKAIFYILIIALLGMSSCTLNFYTTGGYDDVYLTGSNQNKELSINKSLMSIKLITKKLIMQSLIILMIITTMNIMMKMET